MQIIWQRHMQRYTITVLALGQALCEPTFSTITWKHGFKLVKRRISSSKARKEKRLYLGLQDFLFSIKLRLGSPSLKRHFVMPWSNLLWQLIRSVFYFIFLLDIF